MRELDLANVDEARAKDKLSARIAQINLLSRASLSSCQLLFLCVLLSTQKLLSGSVITQHLCRVAPPRENTCSKVTTYRRDVTIHSKAAFVLYNFEPLQALNVLITFDIATSEELQ